MSLSFLGFSTYGGISKPLDWSSSIAAISWGTDAEILGSLIILASGLKTSSPSSDNASLTFCWLFKEFGNEASILPD